MHGLHPGPGESDEVGREEAGFRGNDVEPQHQEQAEEADGGQLETS